MNPDYTDITLVLDRSSSMNTVRQEAMDAVNSLIEEQKDEEGYATLQIVQFNHFVNMGSVQPIDQVEPFTVKNYRPSGTTALLDAVGEAIDATGERLAAMEKAARPANVIMVIQTDGMENASTQYTKSQIQEMIEHQRETYDWTFLFLGEDDSAFQAESMGIPTTFSISYKGENTDTVYASTSALVSEVRTTGSTTGYSEEDRAAAQS